MKRTLVFLTAIGLLIGFLAIPASSVPWAADDTDHPAEQAQALGQGDGHPVFSTDWRPLPASWPFHSDDSTDDTNDDDDLGVCIIGVDSPCNADPWEPPQTEPPQTNESENVDEEPGNPAVTEERDVVPAPEPDGQGENWISYPNPRDHILDYETLESMGDMKICTVLLNQNNDVIDGDTVAGTTINVDTNIGEQQPAYNDAAPVTFTTPLDQVADTVGTDPSLREGDGMLDAECAEYHNLPFGEYEYTPATVTGPNADDLELVGLTEYWDDANRGDPFQSELYSYGQNDLSDGNVTLAPSEDDDHAEVIYVYRLR
jgi:hypothetical protein